MDSETYIYQDGEPGDERHGVSIHAGFPNPAAERDPSRMTLSLNQLLVRHPSSTFFFRLRGKSWREEGIHDGDIAVIDRSLTPQANDLIAVWQGDEFSLYRYRQAPLGTTNFGVITSIIHSFRD
jgi:SOS-response transcriptional repressor LexA